MRCIDGQSLRTSVQVDKSLGQTVTTKNELFVTAGSCDSGQCEITRGSSGRRPCGSNPGSPVAFPRGQNGLPEIWQGRSSPNSLIACRGCGGTGLVSAKLNLLKKTTFYDLRVSEFTSALSLVRGETGTTFRRLRIEETEAMNCTNRLQHWDEQQPKHLSDIRRVGRGLTGHGVVLLAAWSTSAVVNQYGDLACHSAICRTELSYPQNVVKHNRARIFFVLP
jgi:hypothetical protein